MTILVSALGLSLLLAVAPDAGSIRLCEDSDEACFQLALRRADGADLRQFNWEWADALMIQLCRRGFSKACLELGRRAERTWLTGGGVVSWYGEACRLGNIEGCVDLGRVLGDADRPRSKALFEGACEGGFAPGCTALGRWYSPLYHPGAVPPELDRRLFPVHTIEKDLFERACRGGDPQGCADLANLCSMRQLPGCSPARIAELLSKSCDEGLAEACNTLANDLVSSTGGVPQDEPRARQLWQRACDLGAESGCYNLQCSLEPGHCPDD